MSHDQNKLNQAKRIIFQAEIENVDVKRVIPLERCPLSLPLQTYWQLRIIRNTILNGGYLTTDVHIPRAVWFQSNIKISGLTELKEAQHTFCAFSLELETIQNNLSKPFPFICPVESAVKEKEKVDIAKSQVGRFTDMMSSITKNVRRYAEVGYQRLGTAIPITITDQDVSHFAILSAELCLACQALDDWYQFVDQERSKFLDSFQGISTPEEVVARVEILSALLTEQHKISAFIRETVCELLLRDLEQMLERYLKKMRDTFLALPWEEEQAADDNTTFIATRELLT